MQEIAAREEQFRRRAEHERLTREARQQRQQQQVTSCTLDLTDVDTTVPGLHMWVVMCLDSVCARVVTWSAMQHQQQIVLGPTNAVTHDSLASIDTVPAASGLCLALVVDVCLWRPAV